MDHTEAAHVIPLTCSAASNICLAKTNTLAALILGSCASHTWRYRVRGKGGIDQASSASILKLPSVVVLLTVQRTFGCVTIPR